MPRWKETKQLLALKNDGEVFDDNWMNYDRIWQYAPPNPAWVSDREIRFEDVDIWEVITEMSGPIGVYAAWCPYAEYFIVMEGWRIVAEFNGPYANKDLERYLIARNIPYPQGPDMAEPQYEQKKLIIL